MPQQNENVISQIIAAELARLGRGGQTRMADHLGVAVQTVNKWAKGQVVPERAKWPAIEEFLSLDPGTFAAASGLTGPASPPSAGSGDVFNYSREVEGWFAERFGHAPTHTSASIGPEGVKVESSDDEGNVVTGQFGQGDAVEITTAAADGRFTKVLDRLMRDESVPPEQRRRVLEGYKKARRPAPGV